MNTTAIELRERAALCEDLAASAKTEIEREILLRKCDALRELAASEDWLSGQSADASPSAQQVPCQSRLRSLAAE